jgi:adenine-specific DNA-methyltransferase
MFSEIIMGFRYIGSKSKIVDIVVDKIGKIVPAGSHITDLMAGTATVSTALRKEGYRVTANDLMTYSYHHAITGLKFDRIPAFSGARDLIGASEHLENPPTESTANYEKVIKIISEAKPVEGYFWNEFSLAGNPKNTPKPRNYFSTENAKKIDGIRGVINRMKTNNQLTHLEYSLVQHDVLMAVNDVANIAGTYGHFLSTINGRAKDPIKLETSTLYTSSDADKHQVLQGYAEAQAQHISCDLCYIDPPYMKRQYAANYHILETIARGDEPEAIGVSGLRPWRDQYSNFCTKTKIRDSFREIFSNMDCKNYLISYSEDGLLSVDDFRELLVPFGDIEIEEFSHKRFKSNKSTLKGTLTEYMIHLKT